MMSGAVQTVTGPIAPDQLGTTLIHEHVLVDLERPYRDGAATQTPLPLRTENLGAARRSFVRVAGVGVLDDPDSAVNELALFVEAGGATVVDASTVGIRPGAPDAHPGRLAEVARRSGANIVLGSGFYIAAAQTEEILTLDVQGLAEWMLTEIRHGVAGTNVRAGVIGEVGLSQPVQPFEWRSLQAACQVQKATGLPMLIHPYYGANSTIAEEAARSTIEQGVDPTKVVMCHMDGHCDVEPLVRVLELGVWCAFDGFGLEIYYDHDGFNHNTHDSLRELHVMKAIELGYAERLLLSQDVCLKLQLTQYGGFGYGHLLRNIKASIAHRGLSPHQFDALLRDNPRRLFAP